MLTISSREFRANQKSYLDKAAHGLEILITRKNDAFKLTKVSKDDTLVSKEDYYEQLEKAIAEAKEGKTYAMKPNESLDDFLNRMTAEEKKTE